ncbi:hypothetical protein KUTeg_013054 [Tegillarca granosa]|uniref:Uncharacterized protein n=1 Tax=Tegillarca granosa TaxID=220873 RepID=A0ABQ9ESN7_TEGGR|nr:hypothetical protein KUTeg_013054 [Tegillarca granosa]
MRRTNSAIAMASPAGMPNFPNPDAIFDSWWPIGIALVAGFLYAVRQYMRGAKCISTAKLDGKVAIVTGTTSGIGKFVAKDLAKRGCKVYMACRNTELGDKVGKEIKESTKNDHVYCLKCDLTSFDSIHQFVSAFKKSPVLLTHLLLDTLKSSSPSRIVNTAAPAYQLGSVNWEDVNYKTNFVTGTSFAQSKFALMAFSLELATRLQDSGVVVNCALPGVVNTHIYRHLPFRKSVFVSMSFSPFIWYFMKTVEDGAQTTLFCAVADMCGKLSGKLFKECAPHAFVDSVKELELREKLWKETLKWTGIKEFGVSSE